MSKRKRILILLGAIVLCVAAWFVFYPGEPTYQGREISRWLEDYHAVTAGTVAFGSAPAGSVPLDEKARSNVMKHAPEAIRHVGTNAIPFLLRMTAAKESPLKTKSNALLNKQRFISFRFKPALEMRRISITGFQMLGAEAKPAVPRLIELLYNSDPDVRAHAAFNLGSIGSAADNAVPHLIKNLLDTNSTARFYTLQALAHIAQKPDLVVPIMIDTLGKPTTDSTIHDVAIIGLGKLGTNGKPGFSAIIPFLTNNVSYLRRDSSNALKQIDPIAAAKFGIQ